MHMKSTLTVLQPTTQLNNRFKGELRKEAISLQYRLSHFNLAYHLTIDAFVAQWICYIQDLR